ncbi:MAG: hypothetical protein OEY23_15045 [Acidimicrobiia bacterium]|nr:hypothetical protein [Acidimicrobiia bacterium]
MAPRSAADQPFFEPSAGADAAGGTRHPRHGASGDLDRFAAETRVDAAIAARGRTRWFGQVALESHGLAGVCRDLAERGEAVTITTESGRSHRGRLAVAGTDFVAFEPATNGQIVVGHHALASVVADGTRPWGERPAPAGPTLSEALGSLTERRPDVVVWCRGGPAACAGELLACSDELLVLRMASTDQTVYVRLSSVAELLLSVSG